MSGLLVKRLDSLRELRDAALAWDDLWARCEIALPSARAALLALWCESFAAGQRFRAIVVEDDGQAVAALPLVEGKWCALRVGLLPGNHWSPAGDLLLDPHCDVESVCTALIEALKRDAWSLLCFGGVPAATDRWRRLFAAFDAHQLTHVRRQRCTIDTVDIEGDWEAYFSSRSRNHRHHLRQAAKRAERGGNTELVCRDQLTPEQVEPLLKSCFEIEVRGWKGQARSAVLNTPAAWQFYLRQAQQLAAWGQLSLTLLTHEARPIAFEYGWRGKGVYFSPKVGYDESLHRFSPGQLLRYRLLEQLHRQSGIHQVDFLGPSSLATSKWATGQYAIDRVIVATRGRLSRCIVEGHRHYGRLRSIMRSPDAPSAIRRHPARVVGTSVAPEGAREERAGALLD